MCICTCMYMCTCMICLYICIYVCAHPTRAGKAQRTHTHLPTTPPYTHMHIHIHIHIHTHIYTYTHTYIPIHTQVKDLQEPHDDTRTGRTPTVPKAPRSNREKDVLELAQEKGTVAGALVSKLNDAGSAGFKSLRKNISGFSLDSFLFGPPAEGEWRSLWGGIYGCTYGCTYGCIYGCTYGCVLV